MKRKLIISLGLLFILFTAGSGLTIRYIYKTTNDLEVVIRLHRVEIIRKNLVINTQTVQSHLYTFGTAFGSEVDVIVESVSDLDRSLNNCMGCHHSKEITERLKNVSRVVENYKDALSALITTTANIERINRLKMVAIGIGNSFLNMVQEMAFVADQRLYEKTVNAINEINNSKIILMITLSISFFLALGIALVLIKDMSKSLNILINTTKEIKSGKLGTTTTYPFKDELKILADSINDMSLELKKRNEELMSFTKRLTELYRVTLPVYSISGRETLYSEIINAVREIMQAIGCTLLMHDSREHSFIEIPQSSTGLRIPERDLQILYIHFDKKPAAIRGVETLINTSLPLDMEILKRLKIDNGMIIWIRGEEEKLSGAIIFSKFKDEINETDLKLAGILSNIISVSFLNTKLIEDLNKKMQELKDAQEQLIQAAKLTALGEMASNVAHELNNPLTSIIGFTELIKEEKDAEEVKKYLEIIEKESLRARDIVNQLLEFSRKKPVMMEDVTTGTLFNDILQLVELQIKNTRIELRKELNYLPVIKGDYNQLKQVFINLINNAISAMPDGGVLKINTKRIDNSIYISIEDTGTGIPPEILPRIFEPFFTTKKEKGTGLGLPISYRIVENHGGRIEVRSEPNKGSTFIVILPIA